MTYFAILGKHKQISLAELQYIHPENLKTHGPIAIFDTQFPDKLAQLWGIIKRWQVTTLWTLSSLTREGDPKGGGFILPQLIGTNSRLLGKHLKDSWYTKRFKELTLDHCDLEVQDKWQELILIHSNESLDETVQIGVVTGYQDIWLFEVVDFEKPGSGMGIGMMPSKLALTMINIALAHHQSTHETSNSEYPEGWKEEYTIYDPFCGFGTTGFLANAHGYHVICSDINGSLIKPNLTWWQTHARHTDHRFTAFKHDATDPITKPFVKHTDVIVTEWWLWPIVTTRLMPKVAHHQLSQIWAVYCGFLQQIDAYFNDITICMTIPVYRIYEVNVILEMIEDLLGEDKKWSITPIPQVYERKWQFVTRQIVVLQKQSS